MTSQAREREASCRARWADNKDSRCADLRKLWKAYCAGKEDTEDGNIYEYGLAFDYVAPGTFNGQKRGYWRYQISWGGPSEEFRFYGGGANERPERIEFWFLDWFDGYGRKLTGKDEALLLELWDWFADGGSVEAEYNKAHGGDR